MSSPADKVIYGNDAFCLTTHRLTQPGLTAELEEGGAALLICRNGQQRRIELPTVHKGAPSFRSTVPVLEGMYRMAIHELGQDMTADGLMLAGASWSTVWTRDIAYAATLGAALVEPEACRRSLESRVRDGIILQDTGTGGGWPISTDRVVWALGAWTLYLTTGDLDWLAWCAGVIADTLKQDDTVLRRNGALRAGETSFIDWREQSYPDWMEPADIGASYALGTNVLHYTARQLLARILTLLGREEEATPYAEEAARIAKAIEENFWSRATCRYGMLRTEDGYLDERCDALATALAVHCNLAGEHAAQVMRNLPCCPYGTPVFSPYKSSNPACYHNRAVWPFEEAFVLLAHADLQDTARAGRSMAFMLRAAMAFGTNKENFNAQTGESEGTVQNSDRQLWSVAGMLGMYYYGIFGIQYEGSNLVIAPCVPKGLAGSHWLTGLHIRRMVVNIHLNGYGTEVCSILVNGKPGVPVIPLDTVGTVQIELELNPADEQEPPATSPTAQEDLPEPLWDAPTREQLSWHPVPGATSYCIYANGRALANTAACSLALTNHHPHYDEYRVQALSAEASSCLSRPWECPAEGAQYTLQPHRIGEEAEYEVEHNQAWLDTRPCTTHLDYESVELPAGTYRLRVCYSNATASLRDADTCAMRELRVNGEPLGLLVMPHNTEAGQWEDYSLTAPLTVQLEAGTHRFSLHYTPHCRNTSGRVNQCMVRHIALVRIQ